MKFNVFTDKGNFRNTNEDNYLICRENKKYILAAVADGMGGHSAGEVASEIAIDYLCDYSFNLKEDIIEQIEKVTKEINSQILSRSAENDDFSGMGTTLSFLVFYDYTIFLGHVGDSRIYLFHDNQLEQLTTDDTLVQQMVNQGELSPEDNFGHPKSNILTQGLGIDGSIKVETKMVDVKQDDLVLLCTDGLSDIVPFLEIEETIKENLQKENLAKKLGNKALDHGGRDNITLITGIIQ